MIRKLSVSLLAIVAIVAAVNVVCQAESQTLLTSQVRQAVLNGQAKLVGQLPENQTIHFDIELALPHQAELDQFVQQVSDPSSPSYRHFVTVKEFTERFGPSQEDFDAVVAFAKAGGFKVTGGSRDSFDLQLAGSVANIEKAFHVSMGVYQHPKENRTFYAPDREPTPAVSVRLQHISGLDNYALPHPLLQHRDIQEHPETTGSCPGGSFCGSDMRAAYYGSTALTGSGQNIGLLEYAGFDIADVNTYYKNTGQTRTYAVTGISVDGTSINCSEPSCDDTEQTLDITQAGGMAPGVTTIYMYVGSSDTALLSGMSSDTPLPLNLSSSWYWGANPSGDDPYFEKMAAQGQTYFEASGDSGGYTEDSPWPMNSQYVNTVGGTSLTTSGPGGAWSSETYWSYRGTSYGGGGWGTNVELPSWQVQAATTCANEGGECSTTYRDVPDEAANAQFSFYVCADQKACTENEYGGTSFASPMWAGYIALANEQAVTNGSPAPGFLNPTIYPLNLGNGDADFHDITANGGASTFPCVAGYNMCAGWGSPNGDALINALTGPAGPNFTLSASPNSVTVQQGTSGTSTITITPEDGFSGSVTLSASGLPNGVTAQFSPNPATTTSTLTLTASASAATGTVTVTIQGVSGSLTNSTTLSLTVTPSGPVVSLNPTSINFGKKLVGSTSAGKKIILTNTGGSPLSITSIATSAPFALKAVKQTKKVTPCVNGGTVAVGATCEIEVTFSPTAVQSYTGDVTFTDNANPTTQQVSLSGTGKE